MAEHRKQYGRDEKGAKKLFNKIDAHYLLILTFLLTELTEGDLNQKDIDGDVEELIEDLEEDMFEELFEVINKTVVAGITGAVISVVGNWTKKDAEEFLEDSGDEYSEDMTSLLRDLADERTKGSLSDEDVMIIINGSDIMTKQARTLFEDTYEDLLRATENTDKRLKDVIRKVTSEVIQLEGAQSQNNKEIAERLLEALSEDSLYKRLTEDGMIGIVDAGGRRWQLDTYTKMVVNTKVTDAHLQSTKQSADELGLDLAIISHNATTVDACLYWEGVVVSVNGRTEGYPNLDDAIATNEVFHPNCRHHITLITSLDQLTDKQRKEHEDKLPKVAEPELRPYERQS